MEDSYVHARSEKRCDFCSKTFARTEHLIRHRRTHTKERPYACSFCSRSFQRSDVKATHEKTCVEATATRGGFETSTSDIRGRKRVRTACNNCRRRKIACDGSWPCVPCSRAGSDLCQYETLTDTANAVNTNLHSSMSLDLDDQSQYREQQLSHENDAFPPLPTPVFTSSTVTVEGFQQGFDSVDTHDSIFGGTNIMYPQDEAWAFPTATTQFWFDDTELFDTSLFDLDNAPDQDSSSLTFLRLTDKMRSYFETKSRPASPSRDKSSKMWYSRPPDLNNHNLDVIKIFVGLFQRHIPRTFATFREDFAGASRPSLEYVLAMGALGGLFSSVSGSAEVAKFMYNDARRIAHAKFHDHDDDVDANASVSDRLDKIKIFILLHLYGLCSGDKRSYEFAEAFQGDLTHAIRLYAQVSLISEPAPLQDRQSAQLLESLYILDCYRVVIMMRPPSLMWSSMTTLISNASPDSELVNTSNRAASLVGVGTSSSHHPYSSLSPLASLATFLWHAMRPRHNQHTGEPILVEGLSQGKLDFVELACERWIQQHGIPDAEPFDLTCYHTMHIILHTNITVLQMYAHSAPDSRARDPTKSAVAREVHSWITEHHYEVAAWHAEQITKTVEKRLSDAKLDTGPRSQSSTAGEPRRLSYEAPHVPYAIYYATLVLWCKSIAIGGEHSSAAQLRAPIIRGERVLLLHRMHVAQLLARVLGEIQ